MILLGILMMLTDWWVLRRVRWEHTAWAKKIMVQMLEREVRDNTTIQQLEVRMTGIEEQQRELSVHLHELEISQQRFRDRLDKHDAQ